MQPVVSEEVSRSEFMYQYGDHDWIDIKIQRPQPGQKVLAWNGMESWVEESWDDDEPLGGMTGWIPWTH